jgi:hypothetical protein
MRLVLNIPVYIDVLFRYKQAINIESVKTGELDTPGFTISMPWRI